MLCYEKVGVKVMNCSISEIYLSTGCRQGFPWRNSRDKARGKRNYIITVLL